MDVPAREGIVGLSEEEKFDMVVSLTAWMIRKYGDINTLSLLMQE